MTANTDLARANLQTAIARGLEAWKANGRVGDLVPAIADELVKDDWLIQGHEVRQIQEVDFKEETDESRTYEVHTEPDGD